MSSLIAGIGTAVPGTSVPTELFIQHAKKFSCRTARQERILEELYRRTEIASRASVLASYSYGDAGERVFSAPLHEKDLGPGTAERMECYSAEAPALALNASRRALAEANILPESVTHLVTVSCTGFYAPGFDVELVEQLPLRRQTQRTHVGFMGCHGAMNAIRVATALVEADPSAVVLLCTTELCSLHFQYGWSTNNLVANSLFSDGAAALVVTADRKEPPARKFHHVASASFIVPDSRDAMMWRIGNHGFNMQLTTQVPELVKTWLPEWVNTWLARHELRKEEIRGWAVHPGGPKILDAVEQCLALPADALDYARNVLAECGNMSSPTVLFILERMLSAGVQGPCLMLGFGPGLTIEAALFDCH